MIGPEENSHDPELMVLRTYFWSRPHVAAGGQVRFSVALTNETLGEALGVYEIQRSERHMGVSKNTGTPKWMVYNGKPY